MPELVLYGIRLLAKQLLGSILDKGVDHWTSLLWCRPLLTSPELGSGAEPDIQTAGGEPVTSQALYDSSTHWRKQYTSCSSLINPGFLSYFFTSAHNLSKLADISSVASRLQWVINKDWAGLVWDRQKSTLNIYPLKTQIFSTIDNYRNKHITICLSDLMIQLSWYIYR